MVSFCPSAPIVVMKSRHVMIPFYLRFIGAAVVESKLVLAASLMLLYYRLGGHSGKSIEVSGKVGRHESVTPSDVDLDIHPHSRTVCSNNRRGNEQLWFLA